MSFFAATIETLETVKPHPNADRLELGMCKDMTFQFVIGKGIYKVGDKIVYIPIDSILPAELIGKLGLDGKLSGGQKNRVKSVKLRGEISQGIVCNLSIIEGCSDLSPEGITKFLGIEKYEQPDMAEGSCTVAKLNPLPSFLSKYDIEGADRNKKVVEYLMDKKVYVTCKVEGENSAISIDLVNNQQLVCTRSRNVVEIPEVEHGHWKLARKNNIFEKLQNIANELGAKNQITLYSEYCGGGVQGNLYRLTEHQFFSFDIKVDGRFIDSIKFFELCEKYNIQTVPLLSKGITLGEWLNGKTIQDASNGISRISDTLREGIVIKPEVEEWNEYLRGRLVIKQRDPIYLSELN